MCHVITHMLLLSPHVLNYPDPSVFKSNYTKYNIWCDLLFEIMQCYDFLSNVCLNFYQP